MADEFFRLSIEDQAEALKVAAAHTGRPTYILEKDVWVVWALSVVFGDPVGRNFSFKGGTSLSKAWGLIDRFSEDIDLTYDIRSFIPDLVGDQADGMPKSRSQGKKWTEAVRGRLPAWIDDSLKPILVAAMKRDGIYADFRQESKERLYLDYPNHEEGYGYVKPAVMLEFGARSTGEPTEDRQITCYAAESLPDLKFPIATARTMKVERTFWEKATAAHVYCVQGEWNGERFARHWYDMAMISANSVFDSAIADRALANKVAEHKAIFFREPAPGGGAIDYKEATNGKLKLVPEGDALKSLAEDYKAMLSVGLVNGEAPSFDALMENCRVIQDRANGV